MAKILIADDEPHIRILLEQTLEEMEDEGVELLIAENGEEALKIIVTEKPEMVFLDVMMPRINGFEVCNQVRNKFKLMNTYVAMLTAKGQEYDMQKSIEVGANIYFTKPFNPDELVEKAREVLGM